MGRSDPNSGESVILDIVKVNEELRTFWSHAHGWAPRPAAELLAKSRLDRQVALSRCLRLWVDPPNADELEGRLILAWVNLGMLVESTMKFFLSVHERDYWQTPVTRGPNKEPCAIDELEFEELKQFYSKHIWKDAQKKRQKKKWNAWLGKIQQRRNAVHAYKDRDIGTFEEFPFAVETYLDLLRELERWLPYP
jgi:hypothetical protein